MTYVIIQLADRNRRKATLEYHGGDTAQGGQSDSGALNVGPFGRLTNTEVWWVVEGISFSSQAPGELDLRAGGHQVMTVADRQAWKVWKAADLTPPAFQFLRDTPRAFLSYSRCGRSRSPHVRDL